MQEEAINPVLVRLRTLRMEMAGIGAFLAGSIAMKRNTTVDKTGTVHVSPDHCVFQYRSPDGKRRYINIPPAARKEVKRLVDNGWRYRKLEREYRMFMTQFSLANVMPPASDTVGSPSPSRRRRSLQPGPA